MILISWQTPLENVLVLIVHFNVHKWNMNVINSSGVFALKKSKILFEF
jgi:hypothetical protein